MYYILCTKYINNNNQKEGKLYCLQHNYIYVSIRSENIKHVFETAPESKREAMYFNGMRNHNHERRVVDQSRRLLAALDECLG